MEYTTFGRTGLRVSVAGLGCGGNSALGLAKGGSEADAIAVVHKAMDLGINIFDTAHQYETEVALGKAIKGKRDGLVICTKTGSRIGDEIVPTDVMLAELDQSLRDLDVDCIDVFQLQGIAPEHYDRLMAEHVPLLLKEREKGKFRFLGVSEHLRGDIQHTMSSRAARDGVWDSMMICLMSCLADSVLPAPDSPLTTARWLRPDLRMLLKAWSATLKMCGGLAVLLLLAYLAATCTVCVCVCGGGRMREYIHACGCTRLHVCTAAS